MLDFRKADNSQFYLVYLIFQTSFGKLDRLHYLELNLIEVNYLIINIVRKVPIVLALLMEG